MEERNKGGQEGDGGKEGKKEQRGKLMSSRC